MSTTIPRDVGPPTLNAVKRMDFVPNDPLREAVLAAIRAGNITGWSELGGELGVNETQIRRTLGMSHWNRHGERRRSLFCRYDTAVRIVRILGLDPIDYGV